MIPQLNWNPYVDFDIIPYLNWIPYVDLDVVLLHVHHAEFAVEPADEESAHSVQCSDLVRKRGPLAFCGATGVCV